MPVEIHVPPLGESIVEATVGKWLKQEGDSVNAGEPVAELETDKVNIEVMAEQTGILERIVKNEGENVNIGDVIAIINPDGAAAAPAEEAEAPAATARPAEGPEQQAEQAETAEEHIEGVMAPITPVARQIAAEHGIDLRNVVGSGPGGRITKEDVTAHLEKAAQPAVGQEPQQAAAAPKPAEGAPKPQAAPAAAAGPTDRREERVRMSRRRQTIAQRLVEAQQTAAMLTTFNEIDMSAVMDVRKRRKDAFRERHGIGLGFMSFFTKAAVGALKSFPLLNAEIQGTEIVVKHYYDIGIAVSAEEGLVVPVLRDADRKSFAAIEREIADLAKRARDGALSLAQLQGGTFTITNGGIFGSLLSTPILNTPQVGILGMHKIQERPMVVDGQVVVHPMMYVALSYDHRIVDGSEAVRFLVRIKELVEDPEALLLEG
jgi:2-oxoglutarate dehydrogenase E2 component (dihydrolipoamide succinyltransferase)